MPLSLVRLRNFRLSTWVSLVQTWVQVLTRARGGCVVHRCQNKNPIERWTSGCEWRHAPEAHARSILGILKKSVSRVELSSASGEDGWLSGLAAARQICVLRAPHEMGGGGRWQSQNRENLYLSPLNSKVIKSFVPELRSRKCFSCFEIPMFYVYIYIWTFYVHFTHIHIMTMEH